jgi:uncharacterized protein (DUF1778 family)
MRVRAQVGKRRGTTIKVAVVERQVLQRAARLERTTWTTLMRNKAVEWARRRIRRHLVEQQKAKAASAA